MMAGNMACPVERFVSLAHTYTHAHTQFVDSRRMGGLTVTEQPVITSIVITALTVTKQGGLGSELWRPARHRSDWDQQVNWRGDQ